MLKLGRVHGAGGRGVLNYMDPLNDVPSIVLEDGCLAGIINGEETLRREQGIALEVVEWDNRGSTVRAAYVSLSTSTRRVSVRPRLERTDSNSSPPQRENPSLSTVFPDIHPPQAGYFLVINGSGWTD